MTITGTRAADYLSAMGTWPVCTDGYEVRGSVRQSALAERWLVPVADQYRSVDLASSGAGLRRDVDRLAMVLGRTVTTRAAEELVAFASRWGFPSVPEPGRNRRHRLSLAAVRDELRAYQRLRDRWRAIQGQAGPDRWNEAGAAATASARWELGAAVSQYLAGHGVRVAFEPDEQRVALTPRIALAGPVTAAVFAMAVTWTVDDVDVPLPRRPCAVPGCPNLARPRKDAKTCSDACRKRLERLRHRATSG